MRAVRDTGDGVAVVDVPRQSTDGGAGVRVHVLAAGICGSDLHMLGWGLPSTFGHELGGRLDDGTPVTVWPLHPCGSCDRCVAGEPTQCREGISRLYGVSRDGGMADELVVDPSCVVPLPASLDPVSAALAEPLSCSLHALRRASVRGDERVAVVGAGSIGLGAAAVAGWLGCSVDVAARHDAQRAAASALGCGLDPSGEYDVVVDGAGTASSIASCFSLLRPGGTVVLVASYWEPVEFPQFFSQKEPVIVGAAQQRHSAHGGESDLADAVRLLDERSEVATALITHRFPLDRAVEAFAVAADRAAGAIKVVLLP